MKTLRRNKEGIYNTAQNYHRKFSAIAKGARANRPRHQECLVLVETRDTYTPLLHQILQSCARTGAPMEAMNLNVYVGIALLDVYSKSGLIKDASCVFASLPERSEVTWSSMVAGYVQNGLYEEALMFFHRAKMMGLLQNQFTISSAICACVGLAALIEGKQVHAVLCKTGFGLNIFIVSSLIDMYAKCGSIKEAYHAGDDLFEKMQEMGRFPSEVTYVYVLTACSHMGLIESERKYFNLTEHNVSPTVVHYSCMIDLFVLASCRIHGKLHLAEVAAKHLSEIEPNNAGKSWIEIKDKIHSFMVGEFRIIAGIYSKLDCLIEELKIMGYAAETEHDLHYMGENRKHEPLRHHSEKLALTLGLMRLPSNASIRIMKNLRICGDCHSFMKIASSCTGKEIIVRDTNMFHHFKNGCCSCREFW
ncbi:LOW QUALITY PROTEIN: hypothetical protein PRUPE_2G071000 [Prunus persica]|uniref:DYW domain-containing protein n=1 Tax=Prunus persica TaxID=3760 RepID=A0A251QCI9_PRUPE|nr:LOW QUALITY PROTEIN: hypothetical protein PRUPE_2G071000 [Prunus persica]